MSFRRPTGLYTADEALHNAHPPRLSATPNHHGGIMSALTFSHLNSDTFEKESQKKAGRKRPRIREAVSCRQCRSRKIRCDREQPCRPCAERKAGAKCTYSHEKTPAKGQSSKATTPRPDAKSPSSSTTATENGSADVHPSTTTRDQGVLSVSSCVRSVSSSSATTAPRTHIFHGSDRKTRLISVTHWMAPCNEMEGVQALLTGSTEFRSCLQEFAALKERLRRENTVSIHIPVNAITAGGRLSPSILLEGLPDRRTCEEWIGRHFNGYGRIYHIVDPATLASDVDQAFSSFSGTQYENATAINSVFILRILITVALGMQLSGLYRLHGRQLGRLVEDYIHRASQVQKPCIGSIQVLLQLILLKTIMAADTDTEHGIIGVLGLTSHLVLSMGLHRDPVLFERVPYYYAEKRKRLWACYLRLHLAYCVRTGTQFPIRLEDSDCPLPTPSILQPRFTDSVLANETRSSANKWFVGVEKAQNDACFGHISAKLANLVAPVHQTLCSAKPQVTAEQQEKLQAGFSALMADLPPSLQPDTAVTDSIIELQRTMLSIGMHSFLLIVSLSHLFAGSGLSPEVATADAFALQRPQQLEIWEYSLSILSSFQNMCQESVKTKSGSKMATKLKSSTSFKPSVADSSTIAHQLLWTDAGRASLSACLVVGRLRRQEADRAVHFLVQPQQHHTVAVLQQTLSQSLDVLQQIWRTKHHMGPVIAKMSLLLAVTAAVTETLYTNFDDVVASGVEATKQLVSNIKNDVAQRQVYSTASSSGIYNMGPSARPMPAGSTGAPQYSATPLSLPLAVSGVSNPPGLVPASGSMPQPSSFPWTLAAGFDGSVAPIPDLSGGSSTGSHEPSPDYVVGSDSSLFGVEFNAPMSFPFSSAPSYDPACPFTDDVVNTFMGFSGHTTMGMF